MSCSSALRCSLPPICVGPTARCRYGFLVLRSNDATSALRWAASSATSHSVFGTLARTRAQCVSLISWSGCGNVAVSSNRRGVEAGPLGESGIWRQMTSRFRCVALSMISVHPRLLHLRPGHSCSQPEQFSPPSGGHR
eukprot:scaffold31514_cov114-Isochrysis_galbana.AAC.8